MPPQKTVEESSLPINKLNNDTTISRDYDESSTPKRKLWGIHNMLPCELPPDNEFLPVEKYVYIAIDSHTRANSISSENQSPELNNGNTSSAANPQLQNYRNIVDCLRKPDDASKIWKILLALSRKSLTLIVSNPSNHTQLVHLIMRLNPFVIPKCLSPRTSKDDAEKVKEDPTLRYYTECHIADAFFHFMVGLVTAKSIFLVPCLEVLWKLLISQVDAQEERTSRIHSTISTILQLVPTADNNLYPIIQRHIPYSRSAIQKLEWYAKQCLAVVSYCPKFHKQIICLLVEKCLEIDVEIKVENGGKVSLDVKEDEEEEDCYEGEMFGIEIDISNNSAKKKKKDEVKVEVDEMAERLDALMMVLFNHIQKFADSNDNIVDLFNILLDAFNTSIHTTHRSKYVQFLLFYLCGLEDELSRKEKIECLSDYDKIYRKFGSLLLTNIFLNRKSRQYSVCYLASFIARASYVNPATICESISALLRWGCDYIDNRYHYVVASSTNVMERRRNQSDINNSSNHPDLDKQTWKEQMKTHSLFYTVCQAAFYMICFRGKEAVEYYLEESEVEDNCAETLSAFDIGKEKWTKICTHEQLSPLKYCLESVKHEFLYLSEVYDLLPSEFVDSLYKEDEKVTSIKVGNSNNINKTPTKATLVRKKRVSTSILTPAMKEKKRLMKKDNKKKKGDKFGASVGGLGEGKNPLDSFFPFDPYLLRNSHKFIDPYYKYWDGHVDTQDKERESSVEKTYEETSLERDDDESSINIHDDDEDDDNSSIANKSGTSSISEGCNPIISDVDDIEPMSVGSSIGGGMDVDSIGSENISIGEKINRLSAAARRRSQSIGSGSW